MRGTTNIMKRALILAAALGLAAAGCGKCVDATPANLNLNMVRYDESGWPTQWEGQSTCPQYTGCQPGYGVVEGCYFRSKPFPVTAGTTYRLEVTIVAPKDATVRLEWLDANGQQLSTSDTHFSTNTYDNAYASPAKAPAGAASARIYLEATKGAACFGGVNVETCT